MSLPIGVLAGVGGIGSNASVKSGAASLLSTQEVSSAPAAPFSDLLTGAVGQANGLQDQARVAVEGLMTGSGVDVHQAMIATEKADMAFEFALAVRNKAVQAYQQVMQMQF
jgi:flagellar hook-basal body complex protein FliE